MRKFLSGFIATLFIFLLLGAGVLLTAIIYQEFSGENVISEIMDSTISLEKINTTSNTANTENAAITTITDNINNIEASNNLKEEYGFYYKQLSDIQKKFYEGMHNNKENMINGEYVIKFGDIFSNVLLQENGSEILGDDYQAAIDAYIHDNPELFYLDVSKLYLNIETSKTTFKTTYNVYLGPKDGQKYYNDDFKTEDEVRSAILEINSKKDFVLSKLTGDNYKDIKMIHDYLIDNIEYDQSYKGKGTYSLYGALIEKSCVCEGYAKALKFLLDNAGIDCVLVQGTGKNSEGKLESHAWNAVLLKNKWYLVDTTWDDPIIVGNGVVKASIHYKYFLKGTKFMDNDHMTSYQFSEGGKVFRYPVFSEANY